MLQASVVCDHDDVWLRWTVGACPWPRSRGLCGCGGARAQEWGHCRGRVKEWPCEVCMEPLSWVSPTVAPCCVATTSTYPPSRHTYLPASDVAAIDTLLHPSMDACWCTPPTIAGESDNGSVLCGGDRHPLPSRRRRLPVCASHHHRQISNGSREAWW
jgi:hypothetical protein